MARWMVIDAQGVIVNAIEWDGNLRTWQPPKGHAVHRSHEAWAPGYVWDGSKPVNPNPPPPDVRPEQLKDPTFD